MDAAMNAAALSIGVACIIFLSQTNARNLLSAGRLPSGNVARMRAAGLRSNMSGGSARAGVALFQRTRDRNEPLL